MTFGSNVQPKRRVDDKKYVPWGCLCKADAGNGQTVRQVNPGYLKRCIDCRMERP